MNTKLLDRALFLMVLVTGLAFLWLFANLGLTLFADGTLYRVDQPIPVHVGLDEIAVMRFSYTSRYDMVVDEFVTLTCDFQHVYKPLRYQVEAGSHNYIRYFTIPPYQPDAACRLTGIVEYQPLGWFGPALRYHWGSEPFEMGVDSH